jgi:8-oxo-dGTP diphosphatase
MTTVVAAVIERNGLILIGRRRADQKHPLKWEFPGGKVEPGEEPVQALRRELKEELAIEIEGAEEITRFEFQYPGRDAILLIFFRAQQYAGEIVNRIFAELRWTVPGDLPNFDFLEGDIAFVRELAAAARAKQ